MEIIYQDGRLIAINKPHGLLVHRSPIAADVSEFAVQLLRKQIGQRVYPAHRLDRKTSGALLFALDEEMNRIMQALFSERKIEKKYIAIVRGHTADKGEIDYPLKKENGDLQEAFTAFRTLERAEIDIPFGKHQTSRYSLLELIPETGRHHQLRKHLAHIFHPIIGDRPHGCNKQNKLWKEQFDMHTMLLHALELTFQHPVNRRDVIIKAGFHSEFLRAAGILGFTKSVIEQERFL